jgi:hypothetical protein
MLVGAAAVGISYVLAVQGAGAPSATAASSDESNTSLHAAQSGTPSSVPASAADPRTAREVAELKASLVKLQGELSALRADKEPEQASAQADELSPETLARLQAEREEYMAAVEHRFEREPRDEKWAAETVQRIRETLEAEPIMLAALRGIDCRSSSCRMEIGDDGSAKFAEEFPVMMHHMGAVLPEVDFAQLESGDASKVHVMYMAKSSDSAAQEL